MNAVTPMPKTAKQFTDLPYSLKPGMELWGSACGKSIPLSREWWVLKDGVAVSYFNQGFYDNGNVAATQRYRWLKSQGFVDKVVVRDATGQWVWADPK